MSDAKYNSVIHVITDEIVTAFKFENDATWIGKSKDELIATANYCQPGQIIKMVFVKSFSRKDGRKIYSYFRALPGQPKPITNLSGESDNHKKAKQNIYDGIYSGKIKINNEILNKSIIDDIYIEYRTSQKGYVIPDIMIKFKEEHIKYGLGIFIEIQLSNQTNKTTNERTFQRVVNGFSGCWLWIEDFDKLMNIISNNLDISSHKEMLMELEKETENKFISRINSYGNIIDKKLVDYRKEIWNYFNSSYKSFQIESEQFSKDKINKLEIENKKLKELKTLADELNEVFYKTNAEALTNNINKLVSDGLIFLEESIQSKTNKLIENSLNQSRDKINRMCPICNKPMKIGKAMSGYKWYCQDFPLKCNGLIEEVEFNES